MPSWQQHEPKAIWQTRAATLFLVGASWLHFYHAENMFNLLLISIDVLQIKEILVEESNVQPVNSPVTV